MLPVTSLVASVAAVALIALSLDVSLRRMKVGPDVGTGEDAALLRRIRAQGNYIEYVPIGLILLGLAEYRGGSATMLWTIGGLLLAGRLLHAVGMLGGSTAPRALGMLLTYASLLAGAVALAL